MKTKHIHSDLPRWIWIALTWLGFGLVDAMQTVFVMRSEGMHHAWGKLFLVSVFSWLPWALATPLVMRGRGGIRGPCGNRLDRSCRLLCGVHVGAKTHLLRRSIADLEHDLDQEAFCRIHRSTIVNLERVRALKPSEDGEYRVVIHDGTELRLSRRYRKQVQSRLRVRVSD